MSKVLFAVLSALCLAGCVVDQYGRVLPPDPIGQAFSTHSIRGCRSMNRASMWLIAMSHPSAMSERTVAPVSYSDPEWVNGYYGWGGNDWVWVPGRWVQRPRRDVAGMIPATT